MSGTSVADMTDSQRKKANKDDNVFSLMTTKEPEVYTETDEQAIERIRERFDILEEMTEGTTTGAVRAMIVSGPPGVGKSYGVERVMEQASLFDQIANRRNRFEVVKGAIGLLNELNQAKEEPTETPSPAGQDELTAGIQLEESVKDLIFPLGQITQVEKEFFGNKIQANKIIGFQNISFSLR